jgi:GTP pyrophosphokinase
MRTASAVAEATAPIVRLLDPVEARAGGDEVARARAFAAPLVIGRELPTGEGVLAHADGVAAILASIGAAPPLCAAAYLVHAADELGDPDAVLTPLFGESQAALVAHARKLGVLQRTAQGARLSPAERAQQVERVRKMLLAFSQDLRVVLLRLASRLQTLRFFAATKLPCPEDLAAEAMQVFAPLANRLGIWQIKWELEDLAVSLPRPGAVPDDRGPPRRARAPTAKRASRRCGRASPKTSRLHGLQVTVQGRPKHLYSIWKKMKRKGLGFAEVLDVIALRVIAADVADCYAVLGRVHERFRAIAGELDDYIARPKANGYRSLHTVVEADDGSAVEIQIRTGEMHEHAEYGLSAHWAYKEADAARAAVTASGSFEAKVAQAQLVVLRQLLAWERDLAGDGESGDATAAADDAATRVRFDDRIYVFTPQAALVELTAGATPIDFAYAVHTHLGHRCRGAKVDGAIVPLNTALKSGQVVEVIAAKAGGPSLDWLNPELGYLQSARSKAKVRAWFNAQAQQATLTRGRDAVEKVLQREGRTALKHAELAARLGLRSADALYEVVGKDELSLKSIEALLRPAPAPKNDADDIALRPSRSRGEGGVLVVGVGSLLTTLARCCRPAPPDPIAGYVTRGKGVAVHRIGCSNLRELVARSAERVIDVAWGAGDSAQSALYPVDVVVEANDRPGCCATSPRCSPRRRSTSPVCARSRCATAPAARRS